MIKSISMATDDDKAGLGWKILICCLLLIGVGLVNSLWTHLNYQPWYSQLKKPVFSPPSSPIVGMIWTVMYISMGVSVGMLWQIAKKSSSTQKSDRAKKGIRLFIVQIIVNMIVPVFFFAVNNLYLLLTAVIINLLLVLVLIRQFYEVSKEAAYILIPYSVWLLYAIALDGSLLMLN